MRCMKTSLLSEAGRRAGLPAQKEKEVYSKYFSTHDIF